MIKMIKRLSVVTLLIFLFNGCKEKALIHVYDKSIETDPPTCLALSVFPQNDAMESVLKKHYSFTASCPYRLEVSYKTGIHCNSNQNSQTKALCGMPKSYLRMEIHRGFSLKYSYYIDLSEDATAEDVEEGFEEIVSDLGLEKK